MAITINGNGTVTGISVGGLPDGIVDTDMIATEAVTGAKQANGSIIQVVSTIMNDNLYWADAQDWTDITGLAATITPTTNSNKILIYTQVLVANAESNSGDYTSSLAVKRGGSLLSYDTTGNQGYGDYHKYISASDAEGNLRSDTAHFMRLDAPSTDSATTYQICVRPGSSTWDGNDIYINRLNRSDNDWFNATQVNSSITLMEVVA
tara:strand:- start:212 stop:832 length:621 start_codon:yes stop_codon:yes gene_type:complete